MKKSWKKPELIVLVRSRPEESVLGFCKTGGVIIGAAGNIQVGCKYEDSGLGSPCPKCYDSATT